MSEYEQEDQERRDEEEAAAAEEEGVDEFGEPVEDASAAHSPEAIGERLSQMTAEEEERAAAAEQKELDKVREKVDNEDTRHKNRLREILGESFDELVPCPLCAHFAGGFFPPPAAMPVPDDQLRIIRALLDLPDLTKFQEHRNFHVCPDCAGIGQVLTGSLRQGYETANCPGCASKGYVGQGDVAHVIVTEDGETEAPVTGPTVYGTDALPPELQAYRDKGWMVMPPIELNAG